MTLDGNIFCSNAKLRHGNSAETFRPRFAIISQERFPGKAACDVGIFAAFIREAFIYVLAEFVR